MRTKPSQLLRDLLDWLRPPRPGQEMPDVGTTLGLLGAIEDEGDPRAVRDLSRFVIGDDLQLAGAAAHVARTLLATATTADFVWLERHTRSSYPSGHRVERWGTVDQGEVARFANRTEHPTVVRGLLSLHWNGYVREEAVDQLADSTNPLAVPFVLLRLNDWVPQVRTTAVRVVNTWSDDPWLERLALYLPLLTRLTGPVRSRQTSLVRGIEQRLTRQEPPAALLAALRSHDREVGRAALRLGLTTPGPHLDLVLQAALAIHDPVLRFRALRRLVSEQQAGVDRLSALSRALSDPFMPMRREALLALAREFPSRAEPALQNGLFDRHPAIRYTARWELSRDGSPDFAALYREALTESPDPRSLRAAISGLGEVGASTDVPRLLPFLAHGTAGIRKRATSSISKLISPLDASLLLQPLYDDSPKVSKEAARGLEKHASIIGRSTLLDAFHEARAPHVRSHLLHLLARLPVPERLSVLLAVAADGGDPLSEEALRLALMTLGDSTIGASRFSEDEQRTIRRALDQLGPRLGDWPRRQIELVLRASAR